MVSKINIGRLRPTFMATKPPNFETYHLRDKRIIMQFVLTKLGMPDARMAQAEYNPYDSPDEDEEQPELEKVTVAHSVNLERVKSIAESNECHLRWAVFFLSILLNPIKFEKNLLKECVTFPITEPRIRPTCPTKLESLKKLESWKPEGKGNEEKHVLRFAKHGEYALALASYFEVVKKNGALRPIVDLRPLNAWLKTPPHCRLGGGAEILLKLSRLPARCWMSHGDMSGWFHQLSLPRSCHKYFGIKCAGILFFYTVLPMGLRWAPLLAQAILLCIMLMRQPGDKDGDLGIDGAKFGDDIPPGVIEMDRKQGLLVAYIDNTFLVTRNKHHCDRWVKRITNNARVANAKWNPKEVLCQPTQKAEFLGLVILTDGLPTWRHTDKKIAKWLTWWMPFRNPAVLKRDLTPRVVAKICGVSVFDATVRFIPLFELSEIIEILRSLHDIYFLKYKRD